MDAIQAARELGRAIQEDDRYIRVMKAQADNESDTELQEAIEEFNQMRINLNAEVQKQEKDEATIQEMDAQIKEKYGEIFANENMRAFSGARSEFQEMLTFINQIISGSAGGQDPDTIEFQQSCGGSCGSCSGCS